MFQRILVGYQDTEEGRDALTLGTVLAKGDAELIVGAARPGDGEEVAELARAHDADLVVLGASHRGAFNRRAGGATVDGLLRGTRCAVAIAPSGFGRLDEGDSGWRPLSVDENRLRVIGVGYDGTEASRKALEAAANLAIPQGAALRVYAVAYRPDPRLPITDGESDPRSSVESAVMQNMLHAAVADLPAEARALPVLLYGLAAEELIKASDLGVDLLVLGSRSGGALGRMLRHGVRRKVMRRASCPLLISPGKAKARPPGGLQPLHSLAH